ncbi:MAG: beta-lactamase family protein [Candidatus Cloacimonetes bacterium]|nr:beta-lactamase family protein [Candidatus Cloacimonadota bacterium]
MTKNRFKLFYISVLLLLLASCTNSSFDKEIEQYDEKLEVLRKEYKIPSVSVAILHNQEVIFSKGYGYADIENAIAATDSTPYRIASVTKPIASAIILKLIEEGKLNLDGKIKDYWPGYIEHFDNTKQWFEENLPQLIGLMSEYDYTRNDITLRHHLNHTSEGVPGENFSYSGFLYGRLSMLVDNVSERDFETRVREDIIQSLNMSNSLPMQTDTLKPEILNRLAKPYYLNMKNEMVLGGYPETSLGAGAGIISSVIDLAKFDIAFDNNQLISQKSKELAFTPSRLNNGEQIPYGLGWFIGKYKKHKVVYHTGYQPTFSALYLKVPDKNVTLILLANSKELYFPFNEWLSKRQIEGSPFAKEFLDLFITE